MTSRAKLALLYAKLYALTHKIKKRILFISYGGHKYSDSPRAICEKMHELYPEYELVWAFRCPEEKQVPDYIKKISCRGTEYKKYLATACAFVTTRALTEGQFKRKGQYFVQTWHGDRPFKKILYEAGRTSKIMDNELTDLCVAGSDFGKDRYKRAFGYNGAIMSQGMPRNDVLVDNDSQKAIEIKHKLHIDPNKKILLYAPTYRDSEEYTSYKQVISVDIRRTMERLNKNGDWICLIRAHFDSNGLSFECDGEDYIDVTSYDEIGELYLISDCLITDYSSCATDYILLKRPTILAAYDMDEYIKTCRNLYDGFSETGFYIAYTQAELDEMIDHFDELDGAKEYEMVKQFYGIHEMGKSAEKVCRLIRKNCCVK